MKNPFRIRYRIEPIVYDDITMWIITYKKWWQRKWKYFQTEYTGYGFCKMPKQYSTKEEAIASITAYPLN